jgi:hypothetical protein
VSPPLSPGPTPPTRDLSHLSHERWTRVADSGHVPPARPGGARAPLSDAALKTRMDDFFGKSAAKYTVGGHDVNVEPFFRMSNGAGGDDTVRGAEGYKEKVLAAVPAATRTREFTQAVHMAAYGRATPEQLRMVTQALIDNGKLADVRSKYEPMDPAAFKAAHGNVSNHPLSNESAIKLLQWDYGMGIDCAGYVQQAFLATHDGSRSTYGLQSRIGDEDLTHLRGNSAFERATTPVDARPGDLIILKPPAGDTIGHTVLVHDRHQVSAAEGSALGGFGAFAGPTDKVHRIEVEASWGARNGNLDVGGVQRREFLFNEASGKWADVEGGTVKPQDVGPYRGHPLEGVYHPKR